jgi:hypothetical protein
MEEFGLEPYFPSISTVIKPGPVAVTAVAGVIP